MALTRDYRETVMARIQRDPKFTAVLFAEAVSSLTEGDKATALSILRDLVHAHITFKKLAAETGFDEKALHRMLSAHGNPTTANLVQLLRTIEEGLHLKTVVEAEPIRPRRTRVAARRLAYA